MLSKVCEEQKKRVSRDLKKISHLANEKDLQKFEAILGDEAKLKFKSNSESVIHLDLDSSKNVIDYKRRALPKYLINLDQSDYPRFVSSDSLSAAFLIKSLEAVNAIEDQVITSISTKIILNEYTDQCKEQRSENNKNAKNIRTAKIFTFNTELVLTNSINECIKKIVKEAYFSLGVKLKRKSNDSFWGLKFSSCQ